MTYGSEKDTRAGHVKSVFGAQLRFDLKEGFPLLTTKKVFTKGVLHELLWFLQRPYNSHGSMNIEYLIRNGVHIWDDDAYRWFKDKIAKEIKPSKYMVCLDENDDEFFHNTIRGRTNFEYWIEGESKLNDENWLQNITKEEFLDLTLQRVEIWGLWMTKYRFGDLGPVYGTQWRHFGDSSLDQIRQIINTLKTNPNDRRMLCVAYNPNQISDMALPPCHVMFQFYTRELTDNERWESYRKRHLDEPFNEHGTNEYVETYGEAVSPWTKKERKEELKKELDKEGIPVHGLSCMWVQRSVDCACGLPFNIASYAFLTHMIASLVNMEPDMLIGSLGDCHIYSNHFDGVREQLGRKGNELPILKINRKVEKIEDFKYDDFEITNYEPDPPIKYPLNVG